MEVVVALSGYCHVFLEVQGKPHKACQDTKYFSQASPRYESQSVITTPTHLLPVVTFLMLSFELLPCALNFCFKSYERADIKNCGRMLYSRAKHPLCNQYEVYYLMEFNENK
jgi:hypothetical protein